MTNRFFAALCAIACIGSASAESPLWLRNTAISPDGSTVAFTYHGDIFTVPVSGGIATQITSNPAFDTRPIWSPDGKSIAFSSDRMGSADIFIVDAAGGTPKRITTHSANERPLGFLNDTTLLFMANLQPSQKAALGPFMAQTYQVSTKGGRPSLFSSTPMGAVSVAADGRILYQDKKGYEDELRKHERSSGTSDIWLLDNGQYTKLTSFNGHDLEPRWADNNAFYYVSEQDGTLNVWLRDLATGTDQQITSLKRHPVRGLSVARNGTIAFSWDGELYTMTPCQQPKKIDVTIKADDYDADLVKGYRSSGATQIAVSPDAKEVAFTLRGDIYVTSVEYETTRRITNTDGQERCIAFSPDGRSLVYDSERDGKWQLFISKLAKNSDDSFTYATDIIEEPLYSSDYPAQQPEFSPDGKKVAFLENRTALKVIDLDTKAVTTALDGKYNYSYTDGDVPFAWSPDSRWLLISYLGIGGWNNSDIAAVSADGTQVIDLTESGYSDNNPRWALDGKAVTFVSGKYGYKSHGSWGEEDDVFLMVLDPEAWDDFNLSEEDATIKEKKAKGKKDKDSETDKDSDKDKKGKKDKKADEVAPLVMDFGNRQYRTVRLTDTSGHMADYWLAPKGDKLYYIVQTPEGRSNLMVRDLKKNETKALVPNVGYAGIVPSKDGDALFLMSSRGMKKISLPSGDTKDIAFNAEFSRHPSAERAYIYDHAVNQVKDKFYDETLHGVDWAQYAQDYRKFLPYVNNNYDFADVLSELLGELNASHTGASYRSYGNNQAVANLGIFVDESYTGDGLLVSEVIARGPLSTKSANVNPGDIILSIDGTEIGAGQDYYALLEGKSDRKVRLGILKPSSAVEYVEVKPVANISNLLYQRWVERNEAVVDSISGGRIAYVHVKGMDSPSYREVYSKLLGKYRNHDAVIVDTRHNGGGWLHNDIAILLNGKEYVRYTPRGQYVGSDPFSQWTKPSVMLVDESNYSDAHATPYTYKTLGIGEVVGAPVPGTMTAVWWETQIDPTIVFGIPQVTSLDRNGKPLENQQLNPDIEVYNDPAQLEHGIDNQLIQATKRLLEKIK